MTYSLWFRVSSSATPFVVDGLGDGANSQYSSSYKTWTSMGGNQVTTTVGHVPVLGLVAVSQQMIREPRLEVFMEPWSANSSSSRSIEWRLSRAPANAAWAMAVGGWSSTAISYPPCSFWLLNPQTVAMNVTNAHGLAAGSLSLAPGLLHADFGMQVMLSTSLFSNAVRVTVGGGL